MEASKGFSIEMGELIKVTVCPAPIEFFIIHIGVRMHPPCQEQKVAWKPPHYEALEKASSSAGASPNRPLFRRTDGSRKNLKRNMLCVLCFMRGFVPRALRTRVQAADTIFGKFWKIVCATFSSPTPTKYAATKCPGLPRYIAGESATYTERRAMPAFRIRPCNVLG
jgi:hypothetical protein